MDIFSFGCSINLYTNEVLRVFCCCVFPFLFASNVSLTGCNHADSLFTIEEQKKRWLLTCLMLLPTHAGLVYDVTEKWQHLGRVFATIKRRFILTNKTRIRVKTAVYILNNIFFNPFLFICPVMLLCGSSPLSLQ